MFDGLDTDINLLLIPQTDLLRWIDVIQPHVAKMADRSGGRYHVSDIFGALAVGNMLAWVALEGTDLLCLMLTEIHQYPRRRAMRCIGVSGHKPRRWMGLLADAERVSRERFGCDLMESLHDPRHTALHCTGGWSAFHILSEKQL